MNKMITPGQKENAINVIASAARKAGGEAIDELSASGKLNVGNFQRVLARGNRVGAAIKVAVKITLAELTEGIVGCLRRIFSSEEIILVGPNGERTPVAAYEMIKDGSFQQIFGGFGENLRRLCWTEDQVEAFCHDHYDFLQKNGHSSTFFLVEEKSGREFLVASVSCVDNDDCPYRVIYFPYIANVRWSAMCRHRVVVPDYRTTTAEEFKTDIYRRTMHNAFNSVAPDDVA